MLKAEDLSGVPEDLALALIAFAVSEAPCLDRLPAEDDPDEDRVELRKRALAVLRQVAKGAAKRGDLLVRGQRVGSAGVDYGSVGTAFGDDHLTSLRAICARLCGGGPVGMPAGRFPRPGLVGGVWPELEES